MMRKAANPKIIKKIAAVVSAVALAAVMSACSCAGNTKSMENSDNAANEENLIQTQPATQSQAISNTIEWKGKSYKYNRNLDNILFLGIDSSDPLDAEKAPGTAGQADCIMILSLDKETSEGRILQVNRNTMTQLDIYDRFGNKVSTLNGQITLQFAYDIGGTSSCWATKKTVEELLFGLEMDGYFALNLEGLAAINDAIGGVDVTMKEDYTYVDPEFKKGETIHLTGKKAERFVRYRDIEEFNSVQGRMERQTEYITALIAKFRTQGGSRLYDILSPFLDKWIITDLDADRINALRQYEYRTDEVEYIPGEMKMGEKYEEFYPDDEALQDLIIEMFYVEV